MKNKPPRQDWSASPQSIVGGALAGLLIGFCILFFDKDRFERQHYDFIKQTDVRLWLSLSVLYVTLVGATCPPLIISIMKFRPRLGAGNDFTGRVAVWVYLFVLLVGIPLKTAFNFNCSYPLPNSNYKTFALGIVGFVVTAGVGVCLLFVDNALRQVVAPAGETGDKLREAQWERINYYNMLREHSTHLLFILGALLTIYTAVLGLKSRAVSASSQCGATFTPRIVLLYGLFYTGLLAVAYLPTYATLYATGRRLCDGLLPMPDLADDQKWLDWYEKRKKMEELLGLKYGVSESVLAALPVFAPLAGGLYSFLSSNK